VDTRHFSLHYPADLEDWTLALARRLEATDSLVSADVGATPSSRVQIVVDDPYAVANGSAWPFIRQPTINLWASPPDPREDIGQFSDWGELLVSHEFAHIAHLTRPSRNAFVRRLWSLAPADIGPIAIESPRWVIEGYATYVEGRVTGSGRPHGVWRPAILREWALEGQLPTYGQLDQDKRYQGGEFAYLAGSAFLEWLVHRPGQNDSSLVHLWRRLTAKTTRSFDDAFVGVFGDAPSVLYGYFIADVTAKATQARAIEGAGGLDTGAIVQRLSWQTGDPAISPNGKRVAITIRSPTTPGRLVIFNTAAPPDSARARRDSLLVARDPQDVPARPIYPAPRKVLASLPAVGDFGYRGGRWLPGGQLLTWRSTARGDGTTRPALFMWAPPAKTAVEIPGSVGLDNPDPAPDGHSAVATRCLGGHCDIVRIDLTTGTTTTLAQGNPRLSYYRPRLSPDGQTIIAAAAMDGAWRLVRVAAGQAVTRLGPSDNANRYDATFVSADTIVFVSDAGGVPNLERMALSSGATLPLTAATGAAVAPEANHADGSVWFLSLYSRGYDLRRTTATTATTSATATVATLPDSLAPAAPHAPVSHPRLPENAVSPPRAYGIGPRTTRWLPLPEYSADGLSAVLEIANSDPVGRAMFELRAASGDPGTWRGGVAQATWNGTRPSLHLQAFSATQRPDARASAGASLTEGTLDTRLSGALAGLEQTEEFETVQWRARLTGAAGQLSHLQPAPSVVFGASNTLWQVGMTFAAATQQRWGAAHLEGRATGEITLLSEAGYEFARQGYSVSATLRGVTPLPLMASLTGVRSNARDPFEQVSYGGPPSPLLDAALLSQRIMMPALPTGTLHATDASAVRVAIPVGSLQPYVWAGRLDCGADQVTCMRWLRVVGAEWSASMPAIPFAGTPPVRALVGVGRSLDWPFRHQIRGYVSVLVDP